MRPTPVRAAAIFDLDGTLVDTADDLAASMNVALEAAGLAHVDPGEVRGLVGHGARRMLSRGFEIAAGRAAEEAELDAGLSIFLDHYGANIAVHSRPFEGVAELIADLREGGWGVAICTNKREALARQLIDALSLRDAFDVIVGADTTSASKPDPAPVRLCLSATSADRGVFFGDSDTDILAANAAGVPCFVADFGYGPLTRAAQAAGVFSSYHDVAQRLRRGAFP
ncbi:MAG: HAD-IA family hydrolase [Pseudomonadota bacterium]